MHKQKSRANFSSPLPAPLACMLFLVFILFIIIIFLLLLILLLIVLLLLLIVVAAAATVAVVIVASSSACVLKRCPPPPRRGRGRYWGSVRGCAMGGGFTIDRTTCPSPGRLVGYNLLSSPFFQEFLQRVK